MRNDHGYDCQQCGEHFDTRDQLDRHNRQEHTQTRQAGSSNISSSNMGSPSRNSSNSNRDRDLNS